MSVTDYISFLMPTTNKQGRVNILSGRIESDHEEEADKLLHSGGREEHLGIQVILWSLSFYSPAQSDQ